MAVSIKHELNHHVYEAYPLYTVTGHFEHQHVGELLKEGDTVELAAFTIQRTKSGGLDYNFVLRINPPAVPSSEDLDKVADEQKVAELTEAAVVPMPENN